MITILVYWQIVSLQQKKNEDIMYKYYKNCKNFSKCMVIDLLSRSIMQLLYLISDYILANSNPECLNSIQYKAGPNQELTLQETERIIETNLRLEHLEKVLTTSSDVQDNSAGFGF